MNVELIQRRRRMDKITVAAAVGVILGLLAAATLVAIALSA
jgi:ElaB/YqjD/DUF883 family membrane-anchored ribosome-binding protein